MTAVWWISELLGPSAAIVLRRNSPSFVFLGGWRGMRDPNTVAAIVNVLRQVHGDDLARVMLNDGLVMRPNGP